MNGIPIDVCSFFGVEPRAPKELDKIGLSGSARSGRPINGVRVEATEGTCGWFIWAGEMGQADDFFEPVHVAHLGSVCPLAVPFLGLPPGWRFITDGDSCDAWFDADVELS